MHPSTLIRPEGKNHMGDADGEIGVIKYVRFIAGKWRLLGKGAVFSPCSSAFSRLIRLPPSCSSSLGSFSSIDHSLTILLTMQSLRLVDTQKQQIIKDHMKRIAIEKPNSSGLQAF